MLPFTTIVPLTKTPAVLTVVTNEPFPTSNLLEVTIVFVVEFAIVNTEELEIEFTLLFPIVVVEAFIMVLTTPLLNERAEVFVITFDPTVTALVFAMRPPVPVVIIVELTVEFPIFRESFVKLADAPAVLLILKNEEFAYKLLLVLLKLIAKEFAK